MDEIVLNNILESELENEEGEFVYDCNNKINKIHLI